MDYFYFTFIYKLVVYKMSTRLFVSVNLLFKKLQEKQVRFNDNFHFVLSKDLLHIQIQMKQTQLQITTKIIKIK